MRSYKFTILSVGLVLSATILYASVCLPYADFENMSRADYAVMVGSCCGVGDGTNEDCERGSIGGCDADNEDDCEDQTYKTSCSPVTNHYASGDGELKIVDDECGSYVYYQCEWIYNASSTVRDWECRYQSGTSQTCPGDPKTTSGC